MAKYAKLLPLLIALALLAGVPTAVSGQQVETTISFSLTSHTVDEDDGTVQVSMNISTAVPYEVSVDLNTTDGTAVTGQDYTGVSTTVTFPANIISTQAVSITIIDDVRPEYHESFTVSLASDDARVAINGSPATITIESDDTLRLAFEQETYRVSETSGSLRAVVRVVSPTVVCPFDGPFSIRVSTFDYTAVAPGDYRSLFSILNFEPCNIRVALPPITIFNDSSVEFLETFRIRLSPTLSIPNFVAVSLIPATVQIQDDDSVVVGLEDQSYRVEEDAGSVEIAVSLPSASRCAIERPLTFRLASIAGTAVPIGDYLPVAPAVTFEYCHQRRKSVSIQIVDDGMVENLETFTVRLTNTVSTPPPGVLRLDPSRAVVEIVDNDTAVLGFDSADYTVNEDESFDLGINVSGDVTCPVAFPFDVLLGSGIPRGSRPAIARPASRLAFKPCDARRDITVDTGDVEATAELRFELGRASDLDSRISIGQPTATAYVIDQGGTTEAFETLIDAGNTQTNGISSDGTTMWTADLGGQKLYAYNLATKARDTEKDLDPLDAGNGAPDGIWTNGTTTWVADGTADKIFAYDVTTKERNADQDFNTLGAAGNGGPEGIWSDGTTMWVADG